MEEGDKEFIDEQVSKAILDAVEKVFSIKAVYDNKESPIVVGGG
jgi:hypothetical protein